MADVVEFRPWRAFNPDVAASFAGSMRKQRWARLIERFPDLGSMTVLDLGGTPHSWTAAPMVPARLVILNTEPSGENDSVRAEVVKGDACDPPKALATSQFDLVYSNSVIEHVGGHDRRKRFAASARSLASHHWVQTPYRYFPVEPHFVFPGYQHLPLSTRIYIGRHWGPTRRGVHALDRNRAVDFVQSIELLSITEMKAYFPESTLVRERFGSLTKSLIATG